MPDADPQESRLIPVGRVLGVPVRLSPSWFLLAAVIIVAYGPLLAPVGDPTRGFVAAAGFAVLLLVSVLLHELGHCVVARLLGLRVRAITVTFLAGLTEVLDPPQTPGRSAAVSAAGPFVSVLLAGVGALGADVMAPGGSLHAVLSLVALTNAGLAVFNLLPGLPLDGGTVLRAGIWRLTGDPRLATIASAQVGRVLAAVVVPLLLLLGRPLLGLQLTPVGIVSAALVAVFVYNGATAALQGARTEQRLSGLTAGALARPALLVPAGLPLSEAVRRAGDARLHAVVVVDAQGRPAALVSEAAVLAVPEHRRPWIGVEAVARPLTDRLVLDPALSERRLLEAVRATPAGEYLVAGPGAPRVLVADDLARAATGANAAPARATAPFP